MPVAPSVDKPMSAAAGKFSGFLGKINLPFFLVLAALVTYGLLNQFAVTASSEDYSFSRQLLGVGLGLIAMAIAWKIDYKAFAQAVVPLLIVDIVLLLSPHLPFIGYSTGGAASWINIGIRFQPGELAKIVTIIMMAAMVARYQGKFDNTREYLKCLALLSVPFICIMTQPDLGTGLVFLVIGATILFVGGADRRLILITIGVFVGLIAGALLIDPLLDSIAGEDVFIKQYQINRLLVFIDPSLDTTGAGYNVEQARIAVGSGGLFGKGFGNATQSSLGFLPEAPTDFVFCTIAEQFGFVGSMVLLALFAAFLYLTISMARAVTDLFAKLIILGICGMWLFQILESVGMSCGIMPVTGIPLPFFSYGSSFMVVNFICVGVICSIWSRHRGGNKPSAPPKA